VDGIKEGGKLLIQAPNLMKGYLRHGKVFEPTPEWFDTGDIVSVDEKEFISIKGREKQFVKVAGEMISLSVVEEYSKLALGVEEVVAVGLSDIRKGERIEIATTLSNADMTKLRDYWKNNSITLLISSNKNPSF